MFTVEQAEESVLSSTLNFIRLIEVDGLSCTLFLKKEKTLFGLKTFETFKLSAKLCLISEEAWKRLAPIYLENLKLGFFRVLSL